MLLKLLWQLVWSCGEVLTVGSLTAVCNCAVNLLKNVVHQNNGNCWLVVHVTDWLSMLCWTNTTWLPVLCTLCYFAHGSGCKVLWWVCPSVGLSVCLSVFCLSVHEDISGTTHAIIACVVPEISSDDLWHLTFSMLTSCVCTKRVKVIHQRVRSIETGLYVFFTLKLIL